MTSTAHTMTVTLAIPRIVFNAWGTPALAEIALKAQGVWPVGTQSARWHIDPASSMYMAELRVTVTVPEETAL